MLPFAILSLLQLLSEVLVLLVLPTQLVCAHLDLQALCVDWFQQLHCSGHLWISNQKFKNNFSSLWREGGHNYLKMNINVKEMDELHSKVMEKEDKSLQKINATNAVEELHTTVVMCGSRVRKDHPIPKSIP
jgi:hypothetical protein